MSLYAFAGFWRPWEGDWIKDRNKNKTEVYAFLTCDPNPLVEKYHDKAMPVILHLDDCENWLTAVWPEAKKLQKPFPVKRFNTFVFLSISTITKTTKFRPFD